MTIETIKFQGSSFPVLSVLGVVFITLKLTGYIAWSWVWVLAPFWLPISLGVLLIIIAILLKIFN